MGPPPLIPAPGRQSPQTAKEDEMGPGLDRRRLLGSALGAWGAALAPHLAWAQAAASPPIVTAVTGPYVEVETALGRVRGGHSRGALAFKGIPYAGSPAGSGRFKIAPPATPWTGVRDCLHPGPPAIQPAGGSYGELEPAFSEDCLVLNVWTPATGDGRKRPVMVYNHGGGFVGGSGAAVDADGAHLARDFDVVVVATNHRLGYLGYLYLGELGGEDYAASGNVGLLDIVEALRWVKANIEGFGGDPDNVLIWGESGGGMKTCGLCAMPQAAGLFHRVGIMSGPLVHATPRADATLLARAVLAELGVAPTDLHRLQDVPAEAFNRALKVHVGPKGARYNVGRPGIGLGPVLDGAYVTQDPFAPGPAPWLKDVPVVVGLNRDEARFFFWSDHDLAAFTLDEAGLEARIRREFGDAFADHALPVMRQDRPGASPTDLYVAAVDAAWWLQSIAIAERKAAQGGAPAFMYRYDYASNFPVGVGGQVLGPGHATEKPAKFDNGDVGGLMGTRPDRVRMGHVMGELWATFARRGVPGATGQPAWPPYAPDHRATMMIDLQCQVVDDPYPAERRALGQLPPDEV